jgi:choloylglycine hydrolase
MLLIGTITSQVSACTGFSYKDEHNVFACYNDDSGDFNINMRFFSPKDDKHGMVIFEFAFPQSDGIMMLTPCAGMNDQGCWFSGYGTPYLKPVNSLDKPVFTNSDCYYANNIVAILEYCLAECSTVVEIIDIISDYNLEEWSFFQVFVADKTGNSAIIEGDDIIYKNGVFQVVSNFYQSRPELGGYPCDRYDTAVSMLENMEEPSIEYFVDICNATHLRATVSSMICDLEKQIMYLYFLHDYEKQVIIDLNEELEKGEHYIYIGSLFESEGNQPPAKPEPPTGNESGVPDEDIEYRAKKTNDPEGDKVSYLFNWGDGNESLWYYKTMGAISSSYSWKDKGTYEIKVKARDIYGAESEWSDPLQVIIPKNKFTNIYQLILWRFIERYPVLEHLF